MGEVLGDLSSIWSSRSNQLCFNIYVCFCSTYTLPSPQLIIFCLIYMSGAKCWYPDSPHYTHIWDMIPQFCPEIIMVTGFWLLRMNGCQLGLGFAFKCLLFSQFTLLRMWDQVLCIDQLMSRYVLISCIVYLYSLGIQAAKTVKTCKLSEFLHGF